MAAAAAARRRLTRDARVTVKPAPPPAGPGGGPVSLWPRAVNAGITVSLKENRNLNVTVSDFNETCEHENFINFRVTDYCWKGFCLLGFSSSARFSS